jgi:hypothetical protein
LTQYLVFAAQNPTMLRLTNPQELDQLVARLAASPTGMGIDERLQARGNTRQRRTLQRRLASLVAQGRIQTVGEARALRYRVALNVGNASLTAPLATLHATGEACVPTSPEGEAIKAWVRQPRQRRPPVGHQLAFLERHHPNHTAYLPPALRDQLHALGRSPAHQIPPGTFAQGIINRLRIDLSWASSQLEGNTYSRLDAFRRPGAGRFLSAACGQFGSLWHWAAGAGGVAGGAWAGRLMHPSAGYQRPAGARGAGQVGGWGAEKGVFCREIGILSSTLVLQPIHPHRSPHVHHHDPH